MARIAKIPEERRNELIDAATTLFLEKGYEETAVSDIVKKINVAQGTFYYHFKSKSEILEAVVDRFISGIETTLAEIADNRQTPAAIRFNDAVNYLIAIAEGSREVLDDVHQENNAVMHDRIAKMTMARLVPVLARIVDQGAASGEFNAHHPAEATDVILSALFWQFHQPRLMEDKQRLARIRATLEHLLDRMLGTPDHTFVLNLN
ncbi:MAG: TetR/AcrR family transcriptional regulator [Desulfobacteraceae bacterium]|nr:MAG: TetR/AcrR family transcriptional regulator [Desulfobacteraceae bacterium]